MTEGNTVILSLVVALGLALIVGLVIIPALHEAQARSLTATLNNKGQQGDSASGGKRSGGSGGVCPNCG